MAVQNSIISYVPQPFYTAGAPTLTASANIDTITNAAGLFTPDLSDYAIIVPDDSVDSFAVQINFNKMGAHLSGFDVTVALIGCGLLAYEDDNGVPDLSTEFSEDIQCLLTANIGSAATEQFTYAHNSQDNILTFNAQELPSVISGGRSNLVFSGLGQSAAGATAALTATITRTAAAVLARPHARLILGHLFAGVDVPIIIDPRTFVWALSTENARFIARDYGAINSDGTLLRKAGGEIIKLRTEALLGSTITEVATEVLASAQANFFDLAKVNVSYPLLLNPYPRSQPSNTLTVEGANLTARQNFFSIYGFMTEAIELQMGEFRDGLESEYRVRFRFQETR
jgi:hypothetical protein